MYRKYFILITILFGLTVQAETDDIIQLEQRINELTNKLEQLEHKNLLLEKKIDNYIKSNQAQQEAAIRNKPSEESTELKQQPEKTTSAKQDFDSALSLLKEQNYQEAEVSFTKFVKRYPNSEYTGEAYYWLGESFSLRKKYDKAAVNYIMSFNKFPKNNKANLSMLKLVSALSALGKHKEACATVAKLEAKKNSLDATTLKLIKKEKAKAKCN